jgi:hypothetical protein
MGKSRLASIKFVSIPRLELCAAVVSVKLDRMIHAEIDLPIQETIYWTDSTSVLKYIQNESRRFTTFVANRLAMIQDRSTPSQWRHIPSGLHPADHASRGIRIDEKAKLAIWLQGPAFMWETETLWPSRLDISSQLQEDDNEIKKSAHVNVVQDEKMGFDDLLSRYSSWYRLQRAVVWLLKYKEYCKLRYLVKVSPEKLSKCKRLITVEQLQEATRCIVKYVQQKTYPVDIEILQQQTNMKHTKINSTLRDIHPIIEDGVLKVGWTY